MGLYLYIAIFFYKDVSPQGAYKKLMFNTMVLSQKYEIFI